MIYILHKHMSVCVCRLVPPLTPEAARMGTKYSANAFGPNPQKAVLAKCHVDKMSWWRHVLFVTK
jgi:hypothetical protein